MAQNLILGIGNPLLCDDSVGLHTVRDLKESMTPESIDIDFKECFSCDLNLLEELTGYKKVLIIDSIEGSGLKTGTCVELKLEDLNCGACGFASTHGLNLPTLWELGKRLGMDMPGECLLFGIAAGDCVSFKESLSEELESVFEDIVRSIRDKARKWFK